MKYENLVQVCYKLNQEYTGNEIIGLKYPIDFFIIAPKGPRGFDPVINRFWSGIDDGVPLEELSKSILPLELTVFAKNKNAIKNDFFPLEDKLIKSVSTVIIGSALLLKIEETLGKRILKNDFLSKTYNAACEKLYSTSINSRYVPDICNEHDTFCFLFQEWKSQVNLLLEVNNVPSHISLNILGLNMPISQRDRSHSLQLFEEIDMKCRFEHFNIMDHVPRK